MRLEVPLLDAFARITTGFFFLVRAVFVIAGYAGPFITVYAGANLLTGLHGIDLQHAMGLLRLIDAVHT